MRLPEACGGPFHTLPPSSGTLPVPYFLSLRDEPGQPGQVVGGAAEDEQPVHLLQSTQLELA
jgi:hypothetical protein